MDGYLLECAGKLYPQSVIDGYANVCRTSSMSRKTKFLRHLDCLLKQISPLRLDDAPNDEQLEIFTSWLRAYASANSRGSKERGCLKDVQDKLRKLGTHDAYFEAKDADYSEQEKNLYDRWICRIQSRPDFCPAQQRRWGWSAQKQMPVFLGVIENLYTASGTRDPLLCGNISTHLAANFAASVMGKRSGVHCALKLNAPKVELLMMTGFEGSAADLGAYTSDLEKCTLRFREVKERLPGECIVSNDYLILRKMLGVDPWMAYTVPNETLKVRFENYDPKAICAELGVTWNHMQTAHKMFKLLQGELDLQGAKEKCAALRVLLPANTVGLTVYDHYCLRSSWYAEILNRILVGWRAYGHRSAHPDENDAAGKRSIVSCISFIEKYVGEADDCDVPGDCHAFRWFIENATPALLHTITLKYMEDGNRTHKPERVKSAQETHSATKRGVMMIRFFKGGLDNILPAKHASALCLRKLLRQVDNIRDPADPMTRRTYRVEEVDAMLASCKSDSKLTLLLLILSEVGLRLAALRHLQYCDLVDETNEPRHICSVLEKGRARRNFVTSDRLKDAIRTHLARASDAVPLEECQIGKLYVFSEVDPTVPVSPPTITCWLRKLAQAAGVTEINVHPHAFRHTIVGRLMDAGNSLEVVSKYMGHKSLDTTSTHYWVANVQELHESLNNPMTGSYQESARDDKLKDTEIEVLRKKKAKALEVICKTLGALDAVRTAGGSADDVLSRIKEDVPNMAEIIQIIAQDEA